MKFARALAAALLILACAPIRVAHLPDDDRKAIDLFIRSWEAAVGKLNPECFVKEARILHTTSDIEFIRLCKNHPEDAAGCMTQITQQVGIKVYAIPRAVIRPNQLVFDTTGGIVVHELCHWAIGCMFNRRGPNVQDGGHTENRVWLAAAVGLEAKNKTVQGRARLELYPEIFGSPLLSLLHSWFFGRG